MLGVHGCERTSGRLPARSLAAGGLSSISGNPRKPRRRAGAQGGSDAAVVQREVAEAYDHGQV